MDSIKLSINWEEIKTFEELKMILNLLLYDNVLVIPTGEYTNLKNKHLFKIYQDDHI